MELKRLLKLNQIEYKFDYFTFQYIFIYVDWVELDEKGTEKKNSIKSMDWSKPSEREREKSGSSFKAAREKWLERLSFIFFLVTKINKHWDTLNVVLSGRLLTVIFGALVRAGGDRRESYHVGKTQKGGGRPILCCFVLVSERETLRGKVYQTKRPIGFKSESKRWTKREMNPLFLNRLILPFL